MVQKVAGFLEKAIRSNTGVSSLSLILVIMGVMSIVILIVICICMLVEVCSTHTISSSLDGYAAIIGAVAGLLSAAGIPKAINNYGENKFLSQQPDLEESET